MFPPTSCPSSQTNDHGFTLVEALVTSVVFFSLLIGVTQMLTSAARTSRKQQSAAAMQQAQRIAHYDLARTLRMAGRGGLPPWQSVEVFNAVPIGTRVGDDHGASPLVLPGTDLLIVRGVFDTPLYQFATDSIRLGPTAAEDFTWGVVELTDPSPTGARQDLEPLIKALGRRNLPSLILADRRQSAFAVVELSGLSRGTVVHSTNHVTLRFDVGAATATFSSSNTATLPKELSAATSIGILEEWRYYIRSETASRHHPRGLPSRLTKDRFEPGSDTPTTSTGNDLADGVVDLQVALAVDLDRNGDLTDHDSGSDEWLGNSPLDDPTLWDASHPSFEPPTSGAGVIDPLAIRVSTVARSLERDRNQSHWQPLAVEDHVRPELGPEEEFFRYSKNTTLIGRAP